MSAKLSEKEIEKFSRQIILKDIGPLGQKKILSSKVLIIGMGGLGCPAAAFLTRSGIGTLGIVHHDLQFLVCQYQIVLKNLLQDIQAHPSQ